jgi:hypothetical protein
LLVVAPVKRARRRWPVSVLVATGRASSLQAGDFTGGGFIGVLVASYTVGVYKPAGGWVVGFSTVLLAVFIGAGIANDQADWSARLCRGPHSAPDGARRQHASPP